MTVKVRKIRDSWGIVVHYRGRRKSRVIGSQARHYGKDYALYIDWKEFEPWHKTTVQFIGDSRMDQYHQLKQWAENKTQPIRNVILKRRETPDEETGWQVVQEG